MGRQMFMQLPWRGASFSERAAEVLHDPHHPFRESLDRHWPRSCQTLKYHPLTRVGTFCWERGHALQNIDGIYFDIKCHFTPERLKGDTDIFGT